MVSDKGKEPVLDDNASKLTEAKKAVEAAAKEEAKKKANAKLGGIDPKEAQANSCEEGAATEAGKAEPEETKSASKEVAEKDRTTTVAVPRSLLSQIRWRSLDLSDERGSHVLLWQVVAEVLDTPLEKKPRRRKAAPGQGKAIKPDDPGPMTTITLPFSVQRKIKRCAERLSNERGSRVLQWTVIAKAMGVLKE